MAVNPWLQLTIDAKRWHAAYDLAIEEGWSQGAARVRAADAVNAGRKVKAVA